MLVRLQGRIKGRLAFAASRRGDAESEGPALAVNNRRNEGTADDDVYEDVPQRSPHYSKMY